MAGKPENSGEGSTSFEDATRDLFYYGSVSLAVAMAYETGIIAVLCEAQSPLSSTQVAETGKLKERYVREVLSAMAVAGLIRLEAGGGVDVQEPLFFVPEKHRAALKLIGINCGAVSVCARNFAEVRDCFDKDGPTCVRYKSSVFDLFEDWGKLGLESVTKALLKTPGLQEMLEKGIEVAEVGCGSGILIRHLAAMFPKSKFKVTDIVQGPLDLARQKAEEEGLTNLTFDLLDVCKVPDEWKDKFDWLLAQDVIHDLPHPLEALQGIYKALKPGGHFSMIDQFVSSYLAENMKNKRSAVLYSLGTFMCIPESYQQPDSEALGPCWGAEKARQIAEKAGFTVLAFAKIGEEDTGSTKLCMCQKPVQK